VARVLFVTGSKGGVGKSVGVIALLDYFQMGNRQVSLVETDTANPDVGKAYQKDVKSFALANLDENEGWLDLLDKDDKGKLC
jgi:Mrp family chromosome partitioning ATPase